MITQASRDAILLDLGLAYRMGTPVSPTGAPGTLAAAMQPASLTTTHELEQGGFGIRGYRAPEVLRHLPYTLAVDVFAFGRIMINMLSRCVCEPFDLSSLSSALPSPAEYGARLWQCPCAAEAAQCHRIVCQVRRDNGLRRRLLPTIAPVLGL